MKLSEKKLGFWRLFANDWCFPHHPKCSTPESKEEQSHSRPVHWDITSKDLFLSRRSPLECHCVSLTSPPKNAVCYISNFYDCFDESDTCLRDPTMATLYSLRRWVQSFRCNPLIPNNSMKKASETRVSYQPSCAFNAPILEAKSLFSDLHIRALNSLHGMLRIPHLYSDTVGQLTVVEEPGSRRRFPSNLYEICFS